ncbi:MAG: glycosyltransferase [Candidatus Eremiobacteraeota bacterium]|nr:glycosyltransferase [Candidatus Eremiobacteraeota bacterium]MBV9973532.1 glycosyltransferase [Candidatus Eremiobacteraeota bacterium]
MTAQVDGRPLRSLLIMRPDGHTRYGGDTTLVYDTAKALREAGAECDVVESDNPDPRGYDVAHIFNVGQPEVAERQMDACERANATIVLSPVWLDLKELFTRAQAAEDVIVRERSEQKAEAQLQKIRSAPLDKFLNRKQQREFEERERRQSALLRRARVLLPNSTIEARDCMVRLGVRDVPVIAVPIPADLTPAAYWQAERWGVTCVGRVETRKNQSSLTFALRKESVELDLVGALYNPGLAKECERWNARARFHGRIAREQMLKIMGRTEVHALVSWCETAGIASLEAAAAGAKLVVGDRGAEYEYFGDDAEYADPADHHSIAAAVARALRRPPRRKGDSLDQRLRKITWDYAARETLRAYEIALSNT